MTKHILFLFFLFLALACTAGNSLNGEGPATAKTASRDISIMTYNIKMLPRGATFLHHHPVKRARLIPSKIIAENPDVVVFQEAFDGKSIRTIKKGLSVQYPYIAGFANRKLISYKRAGGVLMFSKYPLKEIESIRYNECKGADCMGNKGAMLVQVDHPAQIFQLLGTHMQAGGSHEIKLSQYQQAGDLLKRYQTSGVLQFAAGDYNTHKADTSLYPALVNSLNATDGDLDQEVEVEAAHTMNDMRGPGKKKKSGVPHKPSSKKRGIIDYIFVKENGVKITSQQRYAREYQEQWSTEHKDLSDHFAVILKVKL